MDHLTISVVNILKSDLSHKLSCRHTSSHSHSNCEAFHRCLRSFSSKHNHTAVKQLTAWFLLYCGKMFLNLEPSTRETKDLNFTIANNKKVSAPHPPHPFSVASRKVVSGTSFISSLVKIKVMTFLVSSQYP